MKIKFNINIKLNVEGCNWKINLIKKNKIKNNNQKSENQN